MRIKFGVLLLVGGFFLASNTGIAAELRCKAEGKKVECPTRTTAELEKALSNFEKEADDMMKAIVRENLGSLSSDADRDWTQEGLSVAGDAGLGPNITTAFSWRNVLDVLQDIADTARAAGTETFFRIVRSSPAFGSDDAAYEFRTYIDQLGLDRRAGTSTISTIVSPERGNLGQARLERDYDEEIAFVYGAGQGEGEDRLIDTAFDTARINRSIWGRIEALRDSRHQESDAGVQDDADLALIEGRPRLRFSASLLSVPGFEYGRDWGYGDRLTVRFADVQMEAMIRAVEVRVSADGAEEIDARIETEETFA